MSDWADVIDTAALPGLAPDRRARSVVTRIAVPPKMSNRQHRYLKHQEKHKSETVL